MSAKVIRRTVYLCVKNTLLSNALIDSDMHAHSSKHTPRSSSSPSAICQQKYGLPTASEDRHEYLCLLKTDMQAQLPTWRLDFISFPAPVWKYRLTASNLAERLVSRPPPCDFPRVPQMPVCWCHLRHGNIKWGGTERKRE